MSDEYLDTSIQSISMISVVHYNLNEVFKISLWIGFYILVILLPIYGSCSYYFGTYDFLYGWVLSGAFKSGYYPFIIEFITLNLLILIFLYVTYGSFVNKSNKVVRNISSVDNVILETTQKRNLRYLVYWTFIPLFNFIIVGGVNALYIYLTLYQPSNDLIVYQLSLASFIAFWNGYAFRYMSRFVFYYFPEVSSHSSEYQFVQLFVTTFNNVVIPCFLVAMISKDCVYDVLKSPDPIVTSYKYIQCSQFINGGTVQSHFNLN